jgi:uncharacterized membrane protein YecN with MAPEG domain
MTLLKFSLSQEAFLYLGLFTLFYLVLSFAVIYFRSKTQISLGMGNDSKSPLFKMIRVHANFGEYAPLYILLMIALGMMGVGSYWMHFFGLNFLLSRVLHWIGIFNPKSPNFQRACGSMLTFTALLGMSMWLITLVLW